MNGATSPEGVFREEYSDAPNASGNQRHATSTDDFGTAFSESLPARFDSALPHTNSMLDTKNYRDAAFNGNAAFPPSDDGLLLQMDGLSQDFLSWNSMPGNFRPDAMEMDQLPGVENGMYVDSVSGLGDPLRPDDGSFMQFVKEQNPELPLRFSLDPKYQNDLLNPNSMDSQLQLLQEQEQHQLRQEQLNLHKQRLQQQNRSRSHSNTQHNFSMSQFSVESNISGRTAYEDATPKSYDVEPYGHQILVNGRDPAHLFTSGISPAKAFGSLADEEPGSVEAFNSLPNRTPDADNYSHHTRSRRNTQSHAASYGDFLPLTTTTSLTPSVNSIHSTQQSFFSASQFNRSLFEQPPSLIHRPSFDVYPRGRVSIDSQGSSINPPTRNPRSFASYIPFMGERDRERKSPPDWSQQQPTQQQQSRHLIRSIFKSNNDTSEMDPVPFLADVLVDNDPMETGEMGQERSENPLPSKKAKRTRMNLFNRFKGGKATAPEAQNELVKHETHSSVASSERDDSSFQNSSVVQHSLQNSIKTSNSSTLGQAQVADAQPPTEPDYASLFENVGKRRLGGMKNKKPQIKQENEPGFTSSASITDKSSVNAENRPSTEHSDSGNSAAISQHSSMSEEPFTPATSLSTFANASKRILGLRLLKKKSQAKSEPQADVVEIDLLSLDLPPDTEIIPTINPKVRTRGRKENKAADMNDLSKIFVCTFCLRRFKRQEHLKRHFRSLHTAEKPYECPTCLKKFSRTDNLNQHIKVHKQEEEEAKARAAGLLGENEGVTGENATEAVKTPIKEEEM